MMPKSWWGNYAQTIFKYVNINHISWSTVCSFIQFVSVVCLSRGLQKHTGLSLLFKMCSNIFLAIVWVLVCEVLNFEIYLFFQAVFFHGRKGQYKNVNILKTEIAFKMANLAELFKMWHYTNFDGRIIIHFKSWCANVEKDYYQQQLL